MREHVIGAHSPFLLGFYLIAAILFSCIYLQVTYHWSESDFTDFTYRSGAFHQRVSPLWPMRVLMPLLVRGLAKAIPVDLGWLYRAAAVLTVFASLIIYRSYLANFMFPLLASILAPALIYAMLWNLCMTNKGYLPFDLPSVLFFAAACHFIYRRNWLAYYPTLSLAVLNHDAGYFIVFLFLFCLYGRIQSKLLVLHLLAQVAVCSALKYLVYLWIGTDPTCLLGYSPRCYVSFNARVILDMLTLRGNAYRDWAKFLLAFGGLWLVVPWVWRRQPGFLKRSFLVVVPFLIAMGLKGIVDEARAYVELAPIVITPALYAVAGELTMARSEAEISLWPPKHG